MLSCRVPNVSDPTSDQSHFQYSRGSHGRKHFFKITNPKNSSEFVTDPTSDPTNSEMFSELALCV